MTEPHAHSGHAHHHDHGTHSHAGTDGSHASLVKDPVCGMEMDPATATHRATHHGTTHYFCSAGCQAKFEANPSAYVAEGPAPKADGNKPEGVIYTCPMHPQIRQIGPGNCPICGMALEPEVATQETGPSAELVDMTRRFWIGLVLTVPVLALEMGGHLTNLHMLLGAKAANWIQLVLATPVVLWAGWPFFVRAGRSLVTRHLNMFTLIAMGTGVAWIYSVVATAVPQAFPDTFRAADGSVAIYFEAAAVITVLVLLGQVLEHHPLVVAGLAALDDQRRLGGEQQHLVGGQLRRADPDRHAGFEPEASAPDRADRADLEGDRHRIRPARA